MKKLQLKSSILCMKKIRYQNQLILACGLSNGDINLFTTIDEKLHCLGEIVTVHDFGVNCLDLTTCLLESGAECLIVGSGGDD